MSRIGKLPINIPAGVTFTHKDDIVTVKGPKGELSQYVDPSIKVSLEEGKVTLEENTEMLADNPKQRHAFHGLYRALLHNMVVGYRVSNTGNLLEFSLGYSHSIFFELPSEVKVETKMERNQDPLVMLESCDKQLLGQICAKIRSFRKPEPYKGKGIRFQGEVVRRKSGKSASAK